jgi:hypothetical protein
MDVVQLLLVSSGLEEKPEGSSFLQSRLGLEVAVKLREDLLNQRQFHACLLQDEVARFTRHQLFELEIVHANTGVLNFKL